MKIVLRKVVQTCSACPSQWEGVTVDGRPVYIRYRWGTLTVSVGPVGGTIDDALDVDPQIVIDHGDPLDGTMDFDELSELTGISMEGSDA